MPTGPADAGVAGLPAEAAFLLTAEGRALLERAAAEAGSLHQVVARLRRGASAEQVRAALECVELRRRARAKFDRAGEMYFTPAGLEMASSPAVATHKAARFAGLDQVADLCCGIGGDTLGLAAAAPVVGVDLSPVNAAFAAENCRVYGRGDHVRFRCGDVSAEPPPADAAHIDPDWRAPDGRRNRDPADYRPAKAVLESLVARYRDVAVKIATAADFDALGWDCEIELISERGECKQAVCWFGRFRRSRRSATILPAGRRLTDGPCPPPPVRPVGAYVYEPDPAVIRAGLIDRLCDEHGLAVLDRRIAYLTGDRTLWDPAVAGFRVTDVTAFNLRRLREHLRARGVGTVEVKKRGLSCDPDRLAAELRGRGDRTATLILARVGDRATAILAERLVPEPGPADPTAASGC
jgi:predicted RNA methylase